MNILFVALHNPFISTSGAHQRSLNIIKGLSTFSFVDCLLFEEQLIGEDRHIKSEYCKNIFLYELPCTKNKILKSLKRLNPFLYDGFIKRKYIKGIFHDLILKNKYDKIIFRYVDSYFAICPSLSIKDILIDFDDISWKILYDGFLDKNNSIFKRYFNLYRSYISKVYINRLISSSKTINLFASKDDCIDKNYKYLKNIPYFEGLIPENSKDFNHKNILFVGYLKYFLNDRGINHFIENVWSKLLIRHPDAVLHIVGKGASSKLSQNAKLYPNIELLGYVENLSSIYNKCNVAIVPIDGGSGTNIKLLEALYMSKICVISPHAMRGFSSYFIDKEDLFIAKDNVEYITILDGILSSNAEYQLTNKKGISIVKNQFSFDQFTENLKGIIMDTL